MLPVEVRGVLSKSAALPNWAIGWRQFLSACIRRRAPPQIDVGVRFCARPQSGSSRRQLLSRQPQIMRGDKTTPQLNSEALDEESR